MHSLDPTTHSAFAGAGVARVSARRGLEVVAHRGMSAMMPALRY
jgi:hypothetical protein